MSHVCNKMRKNVSQEQVRMSNRTQPLIFWGQGPPLVWPIFHPNLLQTLVVLGFTDTYKFSLMVFVGEGYFQARNIKKDGNTDMTVCIEQKLGDELVFSTIKLVTPHLLGIVSWTHLHRISRKKLFVRRGVFIHLNNIELEKLLQIDLFVRSDPGLLLKASQDYRAVNQPLPSRSCTAKPSSAKGQRSSGRKLQWRQPLVTSLSHQETTPGSFNM